MKRPFSSIWASAIGMLWLSCLMLLLPAHIQPPAAHAQQGQLEGEVIQIFPTMIVIKNEQGHATVLQLTPRTQVNTTLKPGDNVVVYMTPYGVSSIQLKSSTALIP